MRDKAAAPKFIFLVGGILLEPEDARSMAENNFNFYRQFDPATSADNARAFFLKLVASKPHSEVTMFQAVSFSVPQPARIEEVKP